MKKVIATRPDIAFYLKLTLLGMDSALYEKSKSILCSKSVKLLEDAFEKKPVPKTECASSEIDQNMKFMQDHGITGVPTLIFANGSLNSGYIEEAPLIRRIDEVFAETSGKKPSGGGAGKN
jgi:thiol:disulfide interchange protein DsbC